MILGELCNLSEPEFPRLENMVVMKIHKENACMPSTEQVLDKVIGDYIYVHIYERERALPGPVCMFTVLPKAFPAQHKA